MIKLNGLSEPHGGVLVDCLANQQERVEWLKRSRELIEIPPNSVTIANIEMIAIGGYSPLTGFMDRENYWSVVHEMRLTNGLVWSIPIVLPVPEVLVNDVKGSKFVAICDSELEEVYAIVKVSDIFKREKETEAKEVYGTTDLSHPGVERIYSEPEWLVGGEVIVLKLPQHHFSIQAYYMTPKETREVFISRGYKRVVGFQTRNPLHRAHEYIVKCALETVDGLLLHPLVGPTKSDDIPAEIRMKCYEVLIEKYFPKERVVLTVNPSPMWYAGPREAIFHAIVRKNYGCTHFIIGRDHAGVGNFYDPFAAHRIFDHFTVDELGIVPIFFDDAFYCSKCENMATTKVCPHGSEHRVYFSGTKVRNQLKKGELPPPEITRPEVAQILMEFYRSSGI
ncbi:MAG: sulfate adenylyltransferase [Armatimonadetes bacterium]|nr:sulfate adenylyltransferase [Armatimonadota bacterium]MDW8027517.1 sulfate adenylyltransferase [Armatimonadota bacterium]